MVCLHILVWKSSWIIIDKTSCCILIIFLCAKERESKFSIMAKMIKDPSVGRTLPWTKLFFRIFYDAEYLCMLDLFVSQTREICGSDPSMVQGLSDMRYKAFLYVVFFHDPRFSVVEESLCGLSSFVIGFIYCACVVRARMCVRVCVCVCVCV